MTHSIDDWRFSRGSRTICVSCKSATSGRYVLGTMSIPCCPVCRDNRRIAPFLEENMEAAEATFQEPIEDETPAPFIQAINLGDGLELVPIIHTSKDTNGLDWRFLTGKVMQKCLGCDLDTRGLLVNGLGASLATCTRCRDTKSIFSQITGQQRDDVTVLSSRSRAIGGNVPVELQLPPMLARAFKDVKPEYMKPTILNQEHWIVCEKYDGVRA